MKRFVLTSVLLPLVLCAAEARADCLKVEHGNYDDDRTHYPASMTYDTSAGVTLAMYRYRGRYTARVPKVINGKPNPDFDRLYGLLLKAFPTRSIFELCFNGIITYGATLDITSVTISADDLQKVTICDPSFTDRCAAVDYNNAGFGNELRTSK